MRRKFFALTSVLSLILCAATVVLWVRSYREHFQFAYVRYHRIGCSAYAESGRLRLCLVSYVNSYSTAGFHLAGNDKEAAMAMETFLGDPLLHFPSGNFDASAGEGEFPGLRLAPPDGRILPDFHFWAITIPLWLPAALTSLVVFVLLIRVARHPRRVGCCRSCGYDLRATPERCPECGTVPPKLARSFIRSVV